MSIENILNAVVGFLWGWPLIIVLIGTGLFFTIKSGFWQFRHFGHAIKYFISDMKGEKSGDSTGVLSSIQATSVALASAIGVGNIGGVAAAIALGGPGALFWMWVTALVGMATKMAEVGLAVHYRSIDSNGEAYGGPPYYIERGFKEKGYKGWKALAGIFVFGFIITLFAGLETYTISEAVSAAFNINQILVAAVFILLVFIVIKGGLHRLASVSMVVVPIMSIFYIVVGLFVILKNASALPGTFALIFKSAFNPIAPVAGFGGASFIIAMRTGISRGLYSNEAGWGTAPLIHSTSKVDHPIKQSIHGLIEVFIDTIIVCSITGLAILTTGVWKTGLSGAELTLKAFEVEVGAWSSMIIAVTVFLFGWSTALAWYSYYEIIVRYIFRFNKSLQEKMVTILKYIKVLPGFFITVYAVKNGLPASIVWLIADISSALPTYANLIAILLISGKYFELLRDYNHRELGLLTSDAKLDKLFYEDNIKSEHSKN